MYHFQRVYVVHRMVHHEVLGEMFIDELVETAVPAISPLVKKMS